ncbi:hypothetical protein Dimus_014549 [Dionaea muscipula]
MAETERGIGGGGDFRLNSPFSKQLVEKFMQGNQLISPCVKREEEEEEGPGIELSLGLSSNGKFGVDPTKAQNLARSSSLIPNFLSPPRGAAAEVAGHVPLTRACSLPSEMDDEWRKRKELQTLRRMEAKRKRSEKQKNGRPARGPHLWSSNDGGGKSGILVPKGEMGNQNGLAGGGGAEKIPAVPPPLSSQGSAGSSQGTGSSGISDFDSPTVHETNKSVEAKSPTSTVEYESSPVLNDHKSMVEGAINEKYPFPKLLIGASEPEGTSDYFIRNVLSDMPCVSTKAGDGPNGRKIDGFLYRYRKGTGEGVRIVCVCHGNFFTPAEFVKHAGGGEVEHPLKHIIVKPSPLSSSSSING